MRLPSLLHSENRRRRAGGLLLATLLLLAGACTKEDLKIEPATQAFPPPTPYALALPEFPFPVPLVPLPAANPLTVEGIELGRQLFYEKALSLDNTQSCGSCHQQRRAFTDGLARAVGVAGLPHPRSAMPLQNLLWEPRLTWDGSATALEVQARTPIEAAVEMHQPLAAGVARLQRLAQYPALFGRAFGSSTVSEANVLRALAQFERTLVSSNSRFDRYQRGEPGVLTVEELTGMRLFSTHPDGRVRGGNCADCHGGALQTDRAFRNNGLDATTPDAGLAAVSNRPTDRGKFRVPSLRNIALTAPYMHDGRLPTLEAVLDHYNAHVALTSPNLDPLLFNTTNDPLQLSRTLDLTAREKAQIIAFLRTLTDDEFVQNPQFADPN